MDKTLFGGRRLIYSGLTGKNAKNECSWQRWGIELYRADFTKKTLTFLNFALMPMIKIADGRVAKNMWPLNVTERAFPEVSVLVLDKLALIIRSSPLQLASMLMVSLLRNQI